eukprot:Platyproteum_vivax@DN4786_c0_g1_i1.p1
MTESGLSGSLFCGIDLGAFQSVVATAAMEVPTQVELETNDLSNRSTPSMVGFDGCVRIHGETAESRMSSIPQNTIGNLPNLVGLTNEEAAALKMRFRFSFGDSLTDYFSIPITLPAEEVNIDPVSILAVYLSRLKTFAKQGGRLSKPGDLIKTVVAVPDSCTARQLAAFVDACMLAGVNTKGPVEFITHSEAILMCWVGNNCDFMSFSPAETASRTVAFVDVGHAHATVTIAQVQTKDAEAADDFQPDRYWEVKVLAQETSAQCGVVDMVNALRVLTVARIEALHNCVCVIAPGSKKERRLLHQCERTLKVLSTVPEATIDLEVFLGDETDVSVEVKKADFVKACSGISETLSTLLTTALQQCSETVEGVELMGGGCRIPWVKECVGTVFGEDKIRCTLDGSAAVALGATFKAGPVVNPKLLYSKETLPTVTLTPDNLLRPTECEAVIQHRANTEHLQSLRELEERLKPVEDNETERRFIKNKFESFLLEFLSLRSTLANTDNPWRDTFKTPLVDEAEKWFYDIGVQEETSRELLKEKFEHYQTEILRETSAYWENQKEERAKVEAELTANAKGRSQEDKEDHDDRKMKPSERIKLAAKNKEEGNELFKNGRFEFAAQRYIKALGHTNKVFDSGPQDKAEINKINLSCHLNLAQCYLKAGQEATFRKAVASCDRALEIDTTNVKAMFRRGLANEKLKDVDQAAEDLKAAKKVDPENMDVLRALERVEKLQKAQLEKSKKMYAKMFA